MLFFNSQSKRIIWWVIYAFFCALIGSLGIFRFATVNNQLLKNTVFAALLIVFIMAIMVSILRFYSIQVAEDKNPLANKIALAVVLYFFLLGGGTFFLSEGLLHIANAFFDKSEAESHQVVITNIFTRHNSNGQAYSQGVVVPSWSDKYPSLIDLDAPPSAAERLKIGDNIIIKTKKGGLGYEWIVEVSEVEKTQTEDGSIIFHFDQSVTTEDINQALNTLRPSGGLDWQFYKNEEVGFLFKYPSYINTITTLKNISNTTEDQFNFNLILFVEAIKIDDLEEIAPFNKDRESVLKFKNELEKGTATYAPGGGRKGEIIKIHDDNVYTDIALRSPIEACSIFFRRNLFFFHNDHFVKVSFGSQSVKLANIFVKTMPNFFISQPGCLPIHDNDWGFGQEGYFYETLNNHQGSPLVQAWFDDFDQIVKSLVFLNK